MAMLTDDLQCFTDADAEVDSAKHFNNVIGPAFFDVPLDQVDFYTDKEPASMFNVV